MNDVKQLLSDLIGEWDPITVEGSHFYGVDPQWLAAAALTAVVLIGLFGVVRAVFRGR